MKFQFELQNIKNLGRPVFNAYEWPQNLGSQGAMAQASFTMGLAIDRRISSSITQHNGSNSFLKEHYYL